MGEEIKKEATKKKMTYEELNRVAGELYQQNQNLVARIKQMEEALNDSEFNRMSFLISMLFKVVEHSEQYKSDFVVWCVETIEQSLTAFASNVQTEEDHPEDTAAK